MKKNGSKISLDDLARMTQNGFSGVQKDISSLQTEVHDGFKAMDDRFEKVEKRLDRIENILLRAHENRIEKLEDQMRVTMTRLEKISSK